MIEQILPPQFVNYGVTADGDKIPCSADGRVINAHDPSNWVDYHTALNNKPFGVAFVLSDNDPWFFIDLDKCRVNGVWTPQAEAIFKSFQGAMGEVSISGTGLHIIGKCDKSRLKDRRNKWEGWLEFYTTGRFIAFGHGWQPINNPDYIDYDWTDQLLRFVPQRAELGELPQGRDPTYTGPEDDDELINKMLQSTGGVGQAFGGKASVRQLWSADPSLCAIFPDYGGDVNSFDHSAADASLMAHLAFWTGKDMPRMERLFRRSGLMRPKFDRNDYRLKTIQDAARMCNKVYDHPPKEVNRSVNLPRQIFMSIDQMQDYFDGCTYIVDEHKMLLPTGSLLKPEQFKAKFGGYLFQMNPDQSQPEKNAFTAFTENRTISFPKCETTIFDPKKPFGYIEDDAINTYYPENIRMTPGDVTPFMNHLSEMIPNENDRKILLSWMAALVQNIGVKFQWAPVIQGAEGNGKSMLIRILRYCVGMKYTFEPNARELTEKFNSYLVRTIFCAIDEVDYGGRSDFLETMKPRITNDYIEIRGMQKEKIMKRSVTNYMFCTNYKDAIYKTENDRRYAIFFT